MFVIFESLVNLLYIKPVYLRQESSVEVCFYLGRNKFQKLNRNGDGVFPGSVGVCPEALKPYDNLWHVRDIYHYCSSRVDVCIYLTNIVQFQKVQYTVCLKY